MSETIKNAYQAFWKTISSKSSSKKFMEENYQEIILEELAKNEAISQKFFDKIKYLQENHTDLSKSVEDRSLEFLRNQKEVLENSLKHIKKELEEVNQEIDYLEDFDNEVRKVF
jgi:hypothetical protein